VPVEILVSEEGSLAISVAGLAEIGGPFVADLELADHSQYFSFRDDDAAADLDLWNPESRDSLFQRLLRTTSHDGALSPDPPKDNEPVLADEWALYLRRRQGGGGKAIAARTLGLIDVRYTIARITRRCR
jgi:hypothetical protein